MTRNSDLPTFGKRKEPHTVIIARGNDIRHFTIKPWVAAVAGSAFAAVALGYLLATTYLVLRDDLIGATIARQARMQQAYEDRISSLRSQVDRITSRQLLDQQLVESKVTQLLQRQSELSERNGQLDPLIDKVGAISGPNEVPVPSEKPDQKADAATISPETTSPDRQIASAAALWSTRNQIDPASSAADRADKLFVTINKSLRSIEDDQVARVTKLADNAYYAADGITGALQSAGLEIDTDLSEPAMGGPLVPLDPATAFSSKVKELDGALKALATAKDAAGRFPIANPAPGRAVTSTFGPRRDPLVGSLALHSGMDFRSSIGQDVRATGQGKVLIAGWNGGYGRMVEIDHGDGFTTRYAHMNAVEVRVGDIVKAGDLVGKSGNSGRSTGPHLHYEVRKNGDAVNPLTMIKAGRKVEEFLAAR